MDSKLIKECIRDAMDKMANNPYGATSQLNTRLALEKLAQALKGIDWFEIELDGKDAVIKELHNDADEIDKLNSKLEEIRRCAKDMPLEGGSNQWENGWDAAMNRMSLCLDNEVEK